MLSPVLAVADTEVDSCLTLNRQPEAILSLELSVQATGKALDLPMNEASSLGHTRIPATDGGTNQAQRNQLGHQEEADHSKPTLSPHSTAEAIQGDLELSQESTLLPEPLEAEDVELMRRQPVGNTSVRRLTPTECEILQGFPWAWTVPAIDHWGTPARCKSVTGSRKESKRKANKSAQPEQGDANQET